MRNRQAEQVIKLPRLTFAILLLLILTGAVGIAQQNNEDTISSIRGTYHPVPAHRAATVHKAHRPIVHVVIRRMASPRHVVHFALRHIASTRIAHHKKLKHIVVTVQATIPRHQTIMRKPFLEGKQALESKQTNAAVVSLQQNRKWVVQDQKYVEFSSSGVRFVPRDAKQGPNNVTTKFNLPAGTPWKVAFEVQLFPAANGGMSVYLYQGTTELGWIGAGDFYKSISGFLGTGIGNMPFCQPWDNNWQNFVYASDGKMLSLWHNGSKCGEVPLAGTPDTFTIQSIGMELRVRNVHVETLAGFRNGQEAPVEVSPPPQAPPLMHWSTNGNDQFLEVSEGEVHLKPRTEGTGPGNVTVTCKLTLPNTQTWQASFDIRFGVLRD